MLQMFHVFRQCSCSSLFFEKMPTIRRISRSSLLKKSLKVPLHPTWQPVDDIPREAVTVDGELIQHLERLALVDFGNQEGIDRLSAAVRFAQQLDAVDTEGVEPMDSVLEDRAVFLRRDEVTEGEVRHDVLSNAAHAYEDYYVAPPGNISLKPKKQYLSSSETPETR